MLENDMVIIEEFLLNKSERTNRSYRFEFNRFSDYLNDKYKRDMSLLEITSEDAREFKEYLVQYKYKKKTREEQYGHYDNNTIARILHTLMSFYDKCISDRRECNGKLLAYNPFHAVEMPILENTEVKTEKLLTEAQNQMLLVAAKKSCKRDHAMILLFETSHVTVQEMLNFRWADLQQDGKDWTMCVATRAGKKERRTIPLPDKVVDVLLSYRVEQGVSEYANNEAEAAKKVFLNYRKEPLKEIGIRSILERLCEKAGIPKVTPKELIHLGIILEMMAGASDMQLLEQTGLSRITYIRARYKYAKRKYLFEPACKIVMLPPH